MWLVFIDDLSDEIGPMVATDLFADDVVFTRRLAAQRAIRLSYWGVAQLKSGLIFGELSGRQLNLFGCL